MSGHSKWANIKHKKEKTDAQKAKVFTKIGKEITIAVKEGGGDPNSNAKLRDLIAKAKSNNVPNDNIERTIKKAMGGTGENYEEVVYEGYGPAGVAVIVEATTDNRNRTAGNVRSYFSVVLGEICTHVACGTVAVVGGSGNQNGNACGTVSLVGNLFVGLAGGAQCLLDATLDVIVGNVIGFCLLNQVAELGVGGGVAAACLYCYGDLLTDLGKDLASCRVGLFLLMLNIRPFAMSGHI